MAKRGVKKVTPAKREEMEHYWELCRSAREEYEYEIERLCNACGIEVVDNVVGDTLEEFLELVDEALD